MSRACYHCGLPVPPGADFQLSVQGCEQLFCCPGCQAVASAIIDGGLSGFYRYRTQLNERPAPAARDYSVYDSPQVQRDFVTAVDGDCNRAQLLLEGISCAACVWLIEHHLGKLDGVERVTVNANTRRCSLQWRPAQQSLSGLMAALEAIGYRPVPATDQSRQALLQRESRQALMRLGVAGIGMMQVGMVAIALYAGALQGISENWQMFLRWISLLIATPVVFYSAQPFFQGAYRVLKSAHLSMDVPVATAIGLAYGASCWATLRGSGEVYFDSVSMFTFFLLLGRYLEMHARHANGLESASLARLLPLTVCKVERGRVEHSEHIPLKALQPGHWIRVNAGETIPCDGRVQEGHGGVVEALLTGEADAIEKRTGDLVVAGSVNQEGSLLVEVTAVGGETRLSTIERLVEQAQAEKPRQVAIADRLAGYFVGIVLLTTLVVALLWWHWAAEKALWVSLSVLVVTCPCALSLATPAALTAALTHLRRLGLLVTRGHVIEGLEKVTRVIFDKTGTLTLGQPRVEDVVLCGDLERDYCVAVAAALEAGSSHPIAEAFAEFRGRVYAADLHSETSAGVEGRVGNERFRLGTTAYAMALCRQQTAPIVCDRRSGIEGAAPAPGQWLLLANSRGPQAWIQLRDRLRPEASAAVRALIGRGIDVELLSGDHSSNVKAVAAALGIEDYHSGVSPAQKLAHIRRRQAQGDIVLMVGDGINDIPVLGGADISVAMGAATDLAQSRADSILLHGDLRVLAQALQFSRRTRRVIRQNLSWALLYNGVALPLAAAGWVPPYAAAIGMSLSSLVVVVNALRLGKTAQDPVASKR